MRHPPDQPSSTTKSNAKPPALSELLQSDLRAEKTSNHPQARAPRRPVSEAWPETLSRRFDPCDPVPHRVAVAFVLAEDFGDQVLFRAVGVFVSLVRRGKAVQLAQPKRPTTGALWFFGRLKNRQNVGFPALVFALSEHRRDANFH